MHRQRAQIAVEQMHAFFAVVGEDTQPEPLPPQIREQLDNAFFRLCNVKRRDRIVNVEYQPADSARFQLLQRQFKYGPDVNIRKKTL